MQMKKKLYCGSLWENEDQGGCRINAVLEKNILKYFPLYSNGKHLTSLWARVLGWGHSFNNLIYSNICISVIMALEKRIF